MAASCTSRMRKKLGTTKTRLQLLDLFLSILFAVCAIFLDVLANPLRTKLKDDFSSPNGAAVSFKDVPESISTLNLVLISLGATALCVSLVFGSIRKATGLIYALAWTTLVTAVLKTIGGVPRPMFLEKLSDDSEARQEANKAYDQNSWATVKDIGLKGDVYKSFPSGHSSISAAAMGYLAICLYHCIFNVGLEFNPEASRAPNLRMKIMKFASVVPGPFLLLVIAPCMFSGMIALTRVREGYHSWLDVFTGSAIGYIVAALVASQYVYKRAHVDDLVFEEKKEHFADSDKISAESV